MSDSHDVIVIGLGGMGSAAAWQLARRAARVLGLEQFPFGHNQGSRTVGRRKVTRFGDGQGPRC
jgi:sarcosine oxidase